MDRVGPAAIPPRKWRESGHNIQLAKALAMAVLDFGIPNRLSRTDHNVDDLACPIDTEGRSQIRTSCDLSVCPNQRRDAVGQRCHRRNRLEAGCRLPLESRLYWHFLPYRSIHVVRKFTDLEQPLRLRRPESGERIIRSPLVRERSRLPAFESVRRTVR